MKTLPADRADTQAVVVHMAIAAEPATVWNFFSDGPRFASWIGAYAGQTPMEGTRIDPRVGGEVRVCYPGGNAAVGRITAMEPPRRVAFTWGYEQKVEGLPPEGSQVEITLTPTPEGTMVQLRHTGLPTDEARQGHLGGWTHYLSMLAREAAALQVHAAAQRAFDAYFRAWVESDAAARRSLLTESCEPDVRVRTAFACTDDLDRLDAHVANSQKHMPGMTLRANGPVQTIHDYARVAWSVVTPDGRALFSGINMGVLSLRGRLSHVISFGDPPRG